MSDPHGPIDAVITWVDGSTKTQRDQIQFYLDQSSEDLHENAINPHRWANSNEILYCLQSIANNAPWIRTVWIVTAGERPDLSGLADNVTAKIKFIRHSDIFAGFEAALPTFNSLAIESLIWRIEGLSERFLYFNDDVFLTSPLVPNDVFDGKSPILRGHWVDYSTLVENPERRSDPAEFNRYMHINAAKMLDFPASNIFSAAHVVHPMRRSTMGGLFGTYPQAFYDNIHHRFRDLHQFLPQALYNHQCFSDGDAAIQSAPDNLHIHSGQGSDRPPSETLILLQSALSPTIKFLCVNDLPQLEKLIPDARHWIEEAIGGFGG